MCPPRDPRGWEAALADDPTPAGETDRAGLLARLIALATPAAIVAAIVVAAFAFADGWRTAFRVAP